MKLTVCVKTLTLRYIFFPSDNALALLENKHFIGRKYAKYHENEVIPKK